MLFCRLLIFFKINFFEKFFREYQSVKQLESRSGPTFCRPGLGPNYLQRLSKDDTYKQRAKLILRKGCVIKNLNTLSVSTCELVDEYCNSQVSDIHAKNYSKQCYKLLSWERLSVLQQKMTLETGASLMSRVCIEEWFTDYIPVMG